MRNRLCIDTSWASLNKYSETLCGDRVQIIKNKDDGSMVLVLADGLGSGVKANILSTLTSKIISTMIANEMSIEQCITAIANTLPVCEERKIAYSTFTIIKIDRDLKAHIIEYDNPHTIVLRNGLSFDYSKSISEISGKAIYQSIIQLKENDTLVSMSDGAIYASPGRFMNMQGWTRDSIIDYLEQIYDNNMTAQNIQSSLLEKLYELYDKKPGDDTTVTVLKTRRRSSFDVLIGPPEHREDDESMLSLYFSKKGNKIVCGGTTASLVSKYLDKPIVNIDVPSTNPSIPPMSQIEGIDLVTEGVVTLNKIVDYIAEQYHNPQSIPDYVLNQDPAAFVAKELMETATDINFFVGKAINSTYTNSQSVIEFTAKQKLIRELAKLLELFDKNVKIYKF